MAQVQYPSTAIKVSKEDMSRLDFVGVKRGRSNRSGYGTDNIITFGLVELLQSTMDMTMEDLLKW